MKQCKNCSTLLQDRYCQHCGQSAATGQITFGALWHDIVHFFTHIEKGFWYTSWYLLLSPGRIVKQYIDGKRVRYQRPVSFYLIWTGIYLILLSLIESTFGKETVLIRSDYFGDTQITEVATKYMSVIAGILIPLFALFLQWAGMKRFYNYAESMTAIVYGQGAVLLVQTLFALVTTCLFLLFNIGLHSNVSDVVKGIYVAWFCFDLGRQYPLKHKWLLPILFTLLSLGSFVLWRLYGFVYLWKWLVE